MQSLRPAAAPSQSAVLQVLADSPCRSCTKHASLSQLLAHIRLLPRHANSKYSPARLAATTAVLEGHFQAVKLYRNNYPSLPLGYRKQAQESHCSRASIRITAMARPAGRLMSMLQKQSAEAKAAIEAHLAPAVAKGSVCKLHSPILLFRVLLALRLHQACARACRT